MNIEALGSLAANQVMLAAAEYCHAHNLKADPGALAECCRAHARLRLPEALADAKEAVDCGMKQVAVATFVATMRLAGIEAAKECCLPRPDFLDASPAGEVAQDLAGRVEEE